MPQCCAVPFCSEKKGGHKFPRDESLSKKWLEAIRRPNYAPSRHAIVCKNHFTPDDYSLPKDSVMDNPIPRLIPNAIPSRFAWNYRSEGEKDIILKKKTCRKMPQSAKEYSCTEEIPLEENSMSQQDVEQSATELEPSTEELHIKDEPKSDDEDTPCMETEQLLEIEVPLEIEPIIKQEPRLHTEFIIEEPAIKEEPKVHDEFTEVDTQVNSSERAIIRNVYKFLKEEYHMMKANNHSTCDLTPLANIRRRTAEATGFSENTVSSILNEEFQMPSTSNDLLTPMKKKQKQMLVVLVPKRMKKKTKTGGCKR